MHKWLLVPLRKCSSNSVGFGATGEQEAGNNWEMLKLETKFLRAALKDKESMTADKVDIINRDLIIRGYLEADLLSAKHNLHCRGVIERFVNLKVPSSIGQHKFSSVNTWTMIFTGDQVLLSRLSGLKGFPDNTPEPAKALATAKMIAQFYKRLSNNMHNDPSGQRTCIIDKGFCSEWELNFMIEICNLIPIRHEVV